MFSFLIGLLTLFENFKVKVKKRVQPMLDKQKSIRDDLLGRLEEQEQLTKDRRKKKARALYLLALHAINSILIFFEWLPVFLVFLLVMLIIICVFAVIVVVLSVMNTVSAVDKSPTFTPGTTESGTGVALGGLAWTEDELAAAGQTLTDQERNMYRLGILSRKAIQGYNGKPYFLLNNDLPTSIRLLMGIASTETAMEFYNNNAQMNILEIPSDIPANTKGYGFYGLHKSKTVEGYYPEPGTAAAIKAAYQPKSTPQTEPSFAPWGVAMSARHLTNDINAYIVKDRINKQIEDSMTAWGVVANRAQVKAVITGMLAQAKYHGASHTAEDGEFQTYIDVWLALYSMTSPNDAERSFDKWEVGGSNYSESSFRQRFVGNVAAGDRDILHFSDHSTPLTFQNIDTEGSVIYLNGVKLTKPVWSLLWENYGSDPRIQKAWQKAQWFSRQSGGIHDRVLNYHYGFNSYLQGARIERVLLSKMNIPKQEPTSEAVTIVPGKFKQTPGVGQALVNGVPANDYVKSFYSGSGSTMRGWIDKLRPTFGTSTYLDPKGGNKARAAGYQDKRFGVPFYAQSANQEAYTEIEWYAGSSKSFKRSACMIYSMSYAASAMTQTLINPSEMGVLMAGTNSLVTAGAIVPNMPNTLSKLGVKGQFYKQQRGNWDKIDKVIDQGGVMIIRVKPGSLNFTGYEHFMVITGKTQKNGKPTYMVYTSSNYSQSMESYSASAIEDQFWGRGVKQEGMVAVWK